MCTPPRRFFTKHYQTCAVLDKGHTPRALSTDLTAGAWQDYSKELQFQKINALKDIIEVKVHRGGKQILIPNTQIVVGDVMFLGTYTC